MPDLLVIPAVFLCGAAAPIFLYRELIFRRKATTPREHEAVESIREIGRTTFELIPLLERLSKQLVRLTSAQACAVYLPEKGTGAMLLRASSQGIVTNRAIWIQRVYRTGQTITDFERVGSQTVAVIGVPIRNERAIGGLQIEGCPGQTFSKSEIKLMKIVADQAALIIEKVQEHREIQRIADKMGLVIQVGNAMGGTMDLDEVLKLIVNTAVDEMDVWACSLRLVDQGGVTLVARALAGPAETALYGGPIPVGRSVAGRVFATKQPVVIADLSRDSRFEYPELAEGGRLHSLVCVPLLHRDRAIGTLTVYHNEERFFTSQDVQMLSALATQAAVSIQNVQLVERLKGINFSTIKTMAAALSARDLYTGTHSDEASAYAKIIAEELHLSPEERELLEYGSILHDIGKIGVSDSILSKPGRLTPEEYEIMKQHPRIGAKILEPIEDFRELAQIVAHHHEHFDGTGYPDGLREKEIPLVARILHVVDAFHAMTSDRPYRRALPREVAVQELQRGAGKQFDPLVVSALVDAVCANRL